MTRSMLRQVGLALVLALCGAAAQALVVTDNGVPDPTSFSCPAPVPRGSQPPGGGPSAHTAARRVVQEGDTAVAEAAAPAPGADLTTVTPLAEAGRGPLRIALWGDSHVASGFLAEGLVRGLGVAPQDVLPTFLAVPVPGTRSLAVRQFCLGPGWSLDRAYLARESGGYPLGLVRAHTEQRDSVLWVDFRAPALASGIVTLDVLLTPLADGERERNVVLAISTNDGPERIVSVDRATDPVLKVVSARRLKTLKLRLVAGQLALDGLVPHFDRSPALVLDTFGISGATARGWENLEPQALRPPGGMPYDVVLLAYGTNEGNDPAYDPARYATRLRTTLGHLRAVYPNARCVLLGPPDRVTLRSRPLPGRWASYAQVHRSITEVQRQTGEEFQCQQWDWQSSMGGPGAARHWQQQSPPGMAGDGTHLTALGYQRSGQALGELLRRR